MPSPERRGRQPTPDTLYHHLGPIAKRLIAQVETETGHPVVLRPRGPDIHGSYAHITYATGNAPHTIYLISEATPYLDYLIAHECAHALRLFAVPERERLLAQLPQFEIRMSF